jgi:hypothetical protein
MTNIAARAPGGGRIGVSLPLLVLLLVYGPLLFAARGVFNDPDTYWHIALGRWIIAHGAVPRHDVFSSSMSGGQWTSPEWLAEMGIAGLYDKFGWVGLAAATAFSVAVALAMLSRALLRSLAPVHALIATVLAAGLAKPHLLARPHILALPILVGWTAALTSARSEDRAPPLWLVPVMTLWANLHGSYLFGLGLAVLLAGEAVLLAGDRQARIRAIRGWGLFGALSAAAAFVTPVGMDGVLQSIKLVNMSSLALITEWQSPNFQQFQPLELWLLIVLFAALALGWRLPLTRVGIVLLLLHMALQHVRYAELVGFVAPLLLADGLALQLAGGLARRPATALDRTMAALAEPAKARGIAITGVVLLVVSAAVLRGGIARDSDALTPAAALAAVAAHHVEGQVFNDYSFGGYLIFSGIKPLIDGRGELYGDAFIKRYYEATFLLSDQLPQLLSEYDITWTLLSPKNPAVVLLDNLPGWRRFYADDIAVVHVREDP